MASDRRAAAVGDAITVLIYEASTARSSAQAGSSKDIQLAGRVQGEGANSGGQLSWRGQGASQAQLGRSGTLIGQISVTVDGILPNGDLHISGAQTIALGGEKTKISVSGRVRPQDIGPDNSVLSSRLSDADIVYTGKGSVSRGASPGPVGRVLGWLGAL